MRESAVRCRSAAKVNLTLDILGLRADGYHELSSIIHTVGLYDELRFEFGGPAELLCNRAELNNENNLCLRAARLYCKAAGTDPEKHSARIQLTKVIPAGAGLGGGSGNAAATLMAFNRRYERLDGAALHALAARLGADVPLFLSGGCQLMEGAGERLTPLPPLAGWLLIAQPPEHGDTAAVYRAWDQLHNRPSAPPGEAPANEASTTATAALLEKLRQTGVNYQSTVALTGDLALHLRNGLTPAAEKCGVPAAALASALLECGAAGACMTGSGSAVFGLFDSEARAAEGRDQLLKRANAAGLHIRHAFVAPLCREAIDFWPYS